MNKKTRFIAMASILAAAVAFAAQDGVLLRRELKADSTETYKLETKMNTIVQLPAGMGEQEMSMTTVSSYQIKTGKVDADKGVADIEATTTVESMEADGMLGGMMGGDEKPKPVTLKGKLDRLGKMTLEAPRSSNPMAMIMGGGQQSSTMAVAVEFPDKPVKIGDTWEIVVPKNPMMPEDQKINAKLAGEREVDGRQVWVVALSGNLKMAMGPITLPREGPGGQPNPAAGQKMSMKADMQLTGEALVEKASGRTIRMEQKTKSQQQVALVDMGMTLDSNATMETVATLQK